MSKANSKKQPALEPACDSKKDSHSGGGRSYHHGNLRQSLINIAAGFIREYGEAALSMRKLAALAGVSRTAPYHHFVDKNALLCAIAAAGFQRYNDHMQAIYRQLEQQQVLDKQWLQGYCQAYLQFSSEHFEYYDLMFGAHIWRAEQATSELQQVAKIGFKDFVEKLAEWQSKGWIEPQLQPLRVAQVSWSCLHGMSRLLADGIYLDSQAMQPMVDAAADMLAAYLLPDAT